MEAEDRIPEDLDIPGAIPERWETAIEDIAQVVALGLDRAQDLADVINDLTRTRPAVTQVVLAGVAGAVVGAFIAGRMRPRRPTIVEATGATMRAASQRGMSALEEAASVARGAAERLARGIPSKAEIEKQASRINGASVPDGGRRFAAPDLGQVRYAAELLPIAVTLLRNPLVRDLLIRSALRAARRK